MTIHGEVNGGQLQSRDLEHLLRNMVSTNNVFLLLDS